MSAPSIPLRFLRVHQVKRLNVYVEGKGSIAQNESLLESAVNSPVNQQHYAQENDPARLAAFLSYKLIKNHAFANGNKRTALLAANLFLLQNGQLLQNDPFGVGNDAIIEQAHDDVATEKIDELELAKVYRRAWQAATSQD